MKLRIPGRTINRLTTDDRSAKRAKMFVAMVLHKHNKHNNGNHSNHHSSNNNTTRTTNNLNNNHINNNVTNLNQTFNARAVSDEYFEYLSLKCRVNLDYVNRTSLKETTLVIFNFVSLITKLIRNQCCLEFSRLPCLKG